MNLQISALGVTIILAIYAIVELVLYQVYRKLGSDRLAWAVVIPISVLVLVAPWTDEVFIAQQFRNVCDGAGVNIKRAVETDGFYDGTQRSGYELVERVGYRFMEQPSTDRSKVEHVEKVDGEWQTTVLNAPTARYHYVRTLDEVQMSRAVYCSEDTVVDATTRETLGTYRYCKRYAGFVENLWMRYFDSEAVEYCPVGERQLKGLLHSHVLLPTKKLKGE